jgi:hypothetical protein
VKTIVTEAIPAEAISTKGGRVERRSSIEAARPESWTGVHAAESVAATHMAATKPASPSESAMPTGVSANTGSPAAAHLRRGRHRCREQEDCRNDDRRNGKKATHINIINPDAT